MKTNWSDAPLYQRHSRDEPFGWTPAKTLASPSETMIWYIAEELKRSRGVENELDLAEIYAALRGVKNRWLGAVKANPTIFREPNKHDKMSWDEIKPFLPKL